MLRGKKRTISAMRTLYSLFAQHEPTKQEMKLLHVMHGRQCLNDTPFKLEVLALVLDNDQTLIFAFLKSANLFASRKELDCARLTMQGLKGRPDRAEISLTLLYIVRRYGAKLLCEMYDLSNQVRAHLETPEQWDRSYPSAKVMAEHPHLQEETLWQHTNVREVDKIGTDMLRELHGGILDNDIAECYKQDTNWRAAISSKDAMSNWLKHGEAVSNFRQELDQASKKRISMYQVLQ